MSRIPETFLIESNGQSARFAPCWGGLLLDYHNNGRAVIYCPENWNELLPAKIHFGNPLLFPCASTLDYYGRENVFHWRGVSYRMPQHGFARNLPWAVSDLQEDSITMVLKSSALTRVMFPWDFELTLHYRVGLHGLEVALDIKNLSEEKLPAHFGFHPYLVAEPPHTRHIINVPECRALRLLRGTGSGPVQPESKSLILNSSLSMTRFYEEVNPSEFTLVDRHTNRVITVKADGRVLKNWAIWRPALDSPFVCIEPWSAAPNALNTGVGLLWVEAGQTLRAGMQISTESLQA